MNDSQHDYIGSVNTGKDLSTEIYMFKIDRLSKIADVFFSDFNSLFIWIQR